MVARRLSVVSLVATLALSACSSGSEATDDSSDTTPTTSAQEASDTSEAICAPLLTWQFAQQRFLDELSDVTIAELDQPSPRVLQAGLRLGTTLLEASREALALGCAPELEERSPQRCAQIAQLQAEGPAARSILVALVAECA